MAERQVQVREQTCDVCGSVTLSYPHEDEAPGFYLKSIYLISGGGATCVEGVYVCWRTKCRRVGLQRIFELVGARDFAETHPEPAS